MKFFPIIILLFTCIACMPDVPENMPSSFSSSSSIQICSFNIAFLGLYTHKDNLAVASILKPCDIAVVQELVASPMDVVYPDGDTDAADDEAAAFFYEMEQLGFSYWLSEEDSGPGDAIHSAGSDTEWGVAFYRDNVVAPIPAAPSGFLALNRAANETFARVPYAFRFCTVDERFSFMLISVHLAAGEAAMTQRATEFETIYQWIDNNAVSNEPAFIIGDTNVSGATELAAVLNNDWTSLNAQCEKTNTAETQQCYDHVIYNMNHANTYAATDSFTVIDLIEAMRPFWDASQGPYIGAPYVHDDFRQTYSDHHPVRFNLTL